MTDNILSHYAATSVADSHGRFLRIDFHRCEDRFAHRISWVSLEGCYCLLESVECGADDSWPDSPPMQECHEQPEGEATIVFGVGRAGTSHWSMVARRTTDGQGLLIEVACRVRHTPQKLTSAYRVNQACRLASGPHAASLVITHDDVAFRLRTRSTTTTDVRSNEPGSTATITTSGEGQFHISPSLPQTLSAPSTVRWTYEITK